MSILDNMIEKNLLTQVANISDVPFGAYNIRKNGASAGRASTKNVQILSKFDKPGIDIHVAPGTRGEKIHIPVLLTQSGLHDMVYNEFFIGEGAEVEIIAGCGIHNSGCDTSSHDGIHTFHIGKNAKMKYIEKHYGEGEGTGLRIFNPDTIVELDEGAYCEIETIQIRGVDSTKRYTKVTAGKDAELMITEKLLTHGEQSAISEMEVLLNGENSAARIISRSVAQGCSTQVFYPRLEGNTKCFGHVQCDAIIMDNAKVRATPEISANSLDAQLIHEAAIGRIAGDQVIKLMTLGLTEKEAEEKILGGFLK